MATFTEPDVLSADVANKVHDFDSDTFRLALSNTAPVLASTFLLSNVTQIANGNGYITAADGAGKAVTLSFTRSGQTTTVAISGTAPVWTASGGSIGPFRYIIFWNDTPTTPLNPVIGWLDIVTPVTLTTTQTYTIPLGPLFTIN